MKDGYLAVPMDQERDGKRSVMARTGGHVLRLLVDTGANTTAFDATGLDKWGAKRLGGVQVRGLGKNVEAEEFRLRGLTLGGYDSRRFGQEWMVEHSISPE